MNHRFLLPVLLLAVTLPVPAQETTDGAADQLQILNAEELEQQLREVPADRQVIAEFSTRIRNGRQMFRLRLQNNEDRLPWVALYNITPEQFSQRSEEYAAAGWKVLTQQSYTLNRRRLFLAVWTEGQLQQGLVLPAGPLPEQGQLGRQLEPLNDYFRTLLRAENLPGVTVAVARHGRLIYNRSFGFADVDQQLPMQPDTQLRVASLSKPLTATAVLKLCFEDQLSLEQTLLPLLARHPQQFPITAATEADERWNQVTIRQLLQHTAGFDRDRSGDTMFAIERIRKTLNLQRHPEIADVIRFQLQQPLDFTPGTEFHYSNVGYSLLGRVIETVSGKSYSEFMQEQILDPVEMHNTRLGKTRFGDRGEREAVYVTQKRERKPLVFDLGQIDREGRTTLVETPWGQWDLELMDAHGGWVSTAADLVRFASALDAAEEPQNQRNSIVQRALRPELPDSEAGPVWYGPGWSVRHVSDDRGFNFWHTGLLSGTSALLVRRWDGCCWAVLFNCDRSASGKTAATIVDGPMHSRIDESLKLLPPER